MKSLWIISEWEVSVNKHKYHKQKKTQIIFKVSGDDEGRSGRLSILADAPILCGDCVGKIVQNLPKCGKSAKM
jgi:hypothetical protein